MSIDWIRAKALNCAERRSKGACVLSQHESELLVEFIAVADQLRAGADIGSPSFKKLTTALECFDRVRSRP